MSTQDRAIARDAMDRPSPLYERRIDPGVNTLNPRRVDPPSKLSPTPSRTMNPTNYGAVKR